MVLRNMKILPVLMVLTMMAIAAFQTYWLTKAYERESRTLDMRTNIAFRETVFELQGAKLKLDRLSADTGKKIIVFTEGQKPVRVKSSSDPKVVNMLDVLVRKVKDTGMRGRLVRTRGKDSISFFKGGYGRKNRVMQFLFEMDSLQEPVTTKEIETAYAKRLKEQNISVPFTVSRVPTIDREEPVFNQVTLGFSKPVTFQLQLGNRAPYLFKRISVPVLFSVFLVAFTFLSFALLYRNLLRQRRLSDIKNEFISNITHELKTPIATVSVAIEALRSFNATMDPQRTKEYLDISANELQRLSLLVDKVLKLSMFEKKEVELRYEPLDMKGLVDEVASSMRLQLEKRGAELEVRSEGDTNLEGDRLHLVSVIFNLLDNALKYSSDQPRISIVTRGEPNHVQLLIKDSGIGIPSEYHGKIFEKFFRVPTGNLHNAKGYGLGLSYVSHVIKKHRGSIKVESCEGQGSCFIVSIPKKAHA
jgi:two-component system, OmpR family, phosphate regulon sensor histidine kinase PhoR